MERALAWLDERLRRGRLVTDEEERLTSVWCHLAVAADRLPIHARTDKVAEAEAAAALEKQEDYNPESGSFDDIDSLGLDLDFITDSLERIGVPRADNRDRLAPQCFKAGAEDESALHVDPACMIRVVEVGGLDPFGPLRQVFLHKTFAFQWEGVFPDDYCFEDWLSAFRGTLEIVYHNKYAVVFGSGYAGTLDLLTAANMQGFARKTEGRVRIGAPYPLLMLYPLRLSLLNVKEEGQALPSMPEVLLVKDNLTRGTIRLIQAMEPRTLLAEGATDSAAVRLLQVYAPCSFGLSDLKLDRFLRMIDNLLISSWDTPVVSDVARDTSPAAALLPLKPSPIWRIRFAAWLKNPERDWERFEESFTESVESLCNEWWIHSDPDDRRTIGLMLCVGHTYQSVVVPLLTACSKAFLKRFPNYESAPEEEKQKLFDTAERHISRIVMDLRKV